MKSLRIFLLTFLASAGFYAQQPNPTSSAPTPLFSQDQIKSFTPADNPGSSAEAKLGDMLFDDKRLSKDSSLACNTCHSPRNGLTTHTATSRGVGDQLGMRNAPSILNAMFYKSMFWDGRAGTLEDQAGLPILNPIEMGQQDPQHVVAKLSAIPEFTEAFQRVFGRPVNWDDLRRALATHERTRLSTESPFDRFVSGDARALNDSQRRGWELFNGRARCSTCHTYDPRLPLFGDNQFHNTGVAAGGPHFGQLANHAMKTVGLRRQAEIDKISLSTKYSELGRFLVTRDRADIGAFKTPFLRDVVLTAPYMHNGSLETLWDVVQFFNKGGKQNPYLDHQMKPLGLTDAEIDDLVNFLGALTSDRSAVLGVSELDRQHATYLYRIAELRQTRRAPGAGPFK